MMMRTTKILLAFLPGRDMGRVMKKKLSRWLTGLGSLFAFAQPTMAESLDLGKALPKAEAKNHKGELVRVHEVAAEGLAFFFFYPKALTGG